MDHPQMPEHFRFSKMVLGKYGKMMIKWSTTGFLGHFQTNPYVGRHTHTNPSWKRERHL
jgi:hypothetical protein